MGIVLVKSVIIPLALKAMAIISGKAVLLSALSLILASIGSLKKMAHDWDRKGQVSLKDRGDGTYYNYQQQQGIMDNFENYAAQQWSRNLSSK